MIKPTKERVEEIREKAKRGRPKGSKLTEAHKKNIGRGVGRARKPVLEFSEEDRMKPLKLEQVLELSRQEAEENCKKHNLDLIGWRVEIFAVGEDIWIGNYWEFGLDDAFERVKAMLGWEETRAVGIRWYREKSQERKFLTGVKKINNEGDYWLW